MRDDELQLIKENTVAFFSFSYYRSSTYDQSVDMDGNTGELKGRANPNCKENVRQNLGAGQLIQKVSVML